jgi:hypothetical protein
MTVMLNDKHYGHRKAKLHGDIHFLVVPHIPLSIKVLKSPRCLASPQQLRRRWPLHGATRRCWRGSRGAPDILQKALRFDTIIESVQHVQIMQHPR